MVPHLARSIRPASLLLLLGAACSTAHVVPRASAPAAAASVECAPEAAVPTGLARPGSFLLVGEFHGSKELPAGFGELACAVARRGAPVTVALEVPRSEQASVDAYLGSTGDEAGEKLLLEGPHWTRAYQDGRSSRAMVDLLARVRRLRQAGSRIDVFLFDVEAAEGGPTRDLRMAGHLSEYLRGHPGRAVLVLSGNYHARVAVGAPWNPAQEFMGWHLAQRGEQVASLDWDGPPGSAWACFSAVAAECGPKKVELDRGAGAPPPPGVHLFPARSPEGYDGKLTVGSLTASPPAVAGSNR